MILRGITPTDKKKSIEAWEDLDIKHVDKLRELELSIEEIRENFFRCRDSLVWTFMVDEEKNWILESRSWCEPFPEGKQKTDLIKRTRAHIKKVFHLDSVFAEK